MEEDFCEHTRCLSCIKKFEEHLSHMFTYVLDSRVVAELEFLLTHFACVMLLQITSNLN